MFADINRPDPPCPCRPITVCLPSLPPLSPTLMLTDHRMFTDPPPFPPPPVPMSTDCRMFTEPNPSSFPSDPNHHVDRLPNIYRIPLPHRPPSVGRVLSDPSRRARRNSKRGPTRPCETRGSRRRYHQTGGTGMLPRPRFRRSAVQTSTPSWCCEMCTPGRSRRPIPTFLTIWRYVRQGRKELLRRGWGV